MFDNSGKVIELSIAGEQERAMKEGEKVTITESQLQDNGRYMKKGDETDQTMWPKKWIVAR